MFEDNEGDLELYLGSDSVSRSDLGLESMLAAEPRAPRAKSSLSGRSHKNKYINSIHEMVQELPKDKLLTISQGRDLLPTNAQTVTSNRLSARQSRERKKVYVDLMEAKLTQLEEEKRCLDKQLHEAKDSLLRASTLAQQTAGGFTAGRQLIVKKLTQLLSRKCEGGPDKERNEEEVNMTLDSLRYRISATGKERIGILNEHLKQISSNCFPALTRYLMWSACEGRHFFNGDPESEAEPWFRDLLTSLALTPAQLGEIRRRQGMLGRSKKEVDQFAEEID